MSEKPAARLMSYREALERTDRIREGLRKAEERYAELRELFLPPQPDRSQLSAAVANCWEHAKRIWHTARWARWYCRKEAQPQRKDWELAYTKQFHPAREGLEKAIAEVDRLCCTPRGFAFEIVGDLPEDTEIKESKAELTRIAEERGPFLWPPENALAMFTPPAPYSPASFLGDSQGENAHLVAWEFAFAVSWVTDYVFFKHASDPLRAMQEVWKQLRSHVGRLQFSDLGRLDIELKRERTAAVTSNPSAAIEKGKPGRRGYPAEALAYAKQLRTENPTMKAAAIRKKCLERFSEDDLPDDPESFRRWLNRKRANRAN